ncbi:heavy metal translocating P-type ATPase [Halomonas huangheensis]|uniref:P-type Zn(2+) transporter n=2 Tax=Halomonas huangheensis TaxID=1178482 RepID=W1N359_9GAMM|nr:cation-translocating P-type ATPase [Halomonas huangheensis]ERL50002.1 hypothetical protein BJB45_02425 [Halomonas huangheensis]
MPSHTSSSEELTNTARNSCGSCCASQSSSSAENTSTGESNVQRLALIIDELCCPSEERQLRKALDDLPGIVEMHFQFIDRRLEILHNGIDTTAVFTRIRQAGMSPRAERDVKEAPEQPAFPWLKLIIAGGMALAAELLGWTGQVPEWGLAILALAAIALVGLDTWRKGFIAIRQGNLNINALMSVAVTGALLIGHWAEAAMVLVLFTVSEHIEARSLSRARQAIRGLLDLAPPRARVQQPDGEWREIDAELVQPGDLLRTRAGERLALDGEITRGYPSLDESAITGESLPRDKQPGDQVHAGSINLTGELEYRTTRIASDTTLARIIHAVEQAQARRAPTQQLIDRFAAIYTPAVFVLALLTAVGWPLLGLGPWLDGVYRALVLLVIACPCALVISTPVTIVSGLAAAARQGILIKGGAFLEQAQRLTHVVLDKTGTLTAGRPEVGDWQTLGNVSREQCASLALSLASSSNHPMSMAVAAHLEGSPLSELEQVEERSGRGMVGLYQQQTLWLGNARLAREHGIALEKAALDSSENQSNLWLGRGDELLAAFRITDALRATSQQAIDRLHALGLKISILSGDTAPRVEAIAAELGIDEARAELLPEDKLDYLDRQSRHMTTAMVGDGINDAPALARADLGIAMGVAGSDVAIETADIALMDDDLGKLAQLVELSRATRRLLLQNIGLAIGIKVVFLALALTGHATLWMAVFADMGASLLVVGNGLRILRHAR